MSFATALVLFLPTIGAAQTQESADPSASVASPLVRIFSDRGEDRSQRIATDAAGNFYIAAELDDFHHNNAFGVVKYSAQGKLLGAFHFNPRSLSSGFANDVKVDGKGNIYAGGFTFPFGGLVMSFDPSGNTRWTQFVGDDIARLALDKSGNVYAGGNSADAMVVAKFSADGSHLWTRMHHGTTPSQCTQGETMCRVTDLQLDRNGNVIAFGVTTNANPAADTTTLKINPQGKILWVRNFAQQPQFNKIPAAGAVDHNDGIYATGQGLNPFTGERFPYTVKYDTNGNSIFVLTGAGIGGTSIAVDPAGDILLSGFTLVQGNPVSTASKLDPSGKQIWDTQIPASFGGIVNDSKGNVYVAGSEAGVGFAVSKLDSAGKLLFTFNRQMQKFLSIEVTSSAVDASDNLLVTGFGTPNSGGLDHIVTLKLPKGFKPTSSH